MTISQGWGFTGWILSAGLGLAGCATTVDYKLAHDIRGDAAVTAHQAQPLVAGPIRLLHANFEGRTAPQFSRVWRRDDHADCASGTALAWDGQSTVELRKDELICVGAATPGRIWWHGRSLNETAPASTEQASLP
jgi:hypothetical protein